jgi:hypothetical protein
MDIKLRRLKSLDKREILIAYYQVNGESDEKIATRIGDRDVKTVRRVRTDIYRKLRVQGKDSAQKQKFSDEYKTLINSEIKSTEDLEKWETEPFNEDEKTQEEYEKPIRRPIWLLPFLTGAFLMCVLIGGAGYWAVTNGWVALPQNYTYTPPIPTSPLESPTVAQTGITEIIPPPPTIDVALAVSETLAAMTALAPLPTETSSFSGPVQATNPTDIPTRTPKPSYMMGEWVEMERSVFVGIYNSIDLVPGNPPVK